ncbi:MAG: type II secretion system protein [Phycisphaerales bacterium]
MIHAKNGNQRAEANGRVVSLPRRRSNRSTLAAFTLIELLVVVATLSLITLGIARIFRSAGDTARAGRRVSALNTYATALERQFRGDFDSMSRQGFLLIRNQATGVNVRLSGTDANPARPRRLDELLFFTKGDYTSQRTPVHPDRAPRSAEAMVYYGHGLRWDPTNSNYRSDLRLDDDNASAPGFGMTGPNQYASQWVLARRAFVLQPPSLCPTAALPANLPQLTPTWPGPPANPAMPNSIWRDLDRNCQIGLQPAALSAFRVISNDNRNTLPITANLVRDDSPVQRPRLSSGIVDVIASSLSEIKGVVLDAQPVNSVIVPFNLNADLPSDGRVGAVFQTDLMPGAPNSVTRIMHDWMRQALPADSDGGRRVRLEIDSPDWTGSRDSASAAPYDREYRRTDQEMLSSFNFVPHCTEFIVEWSFGKVYPVDYPVPELRGQVIWHGKTRSVDLNGDGNMPSETIPNPQPNIEYAARPYMSALSDQYYAPIRLTTGSVSYWQVKRELVMPLPPPIGGNAQPVYSYFGYVDPTWRVRSEFVDLNGNGICDPMGEAFDDANGNGAYDPAGTPPYNIAELPLGNGDPYFDPGLATPSGAAPERRFPGDPDTIPWAWPKLIRVTMSLVDPQDPLNEQTFQFTFEVPEDSSATANY